jgi:uncharacterized protein YndB with AHSA1/START domain
MDNKEIRIERVFNATPEEVFKAWTTPEIIKKWWGPEGFYAPSIKVDLRVGGKYIFAMHGPKGSQWDNDMYSAGVYREIVPNEKLVVTDYFSDENGEFMEPKEQGQDVNFPKEMEVTVLFEKISADKTKLSIIYPYPGSEEKLQAMLKSGMKEGWSSSLDKLEKTLE